MENREKLVITPKTKVLELIENYPQLEDVLIEYAPAFKKLKNPVLRKTVAKIATLQQAASVGNVKVEVLINRLREEVGQNLLENTEDKNYNVSRPEWFDEHLVYQELDVSELFAAGEQPVAQVIADLRKLPEGKIYKLIAPFVPAPLIDKATSLNVDHWLDKKSEEKIVVYFFNSVKTNKH